MSRDELLTPAASDEDTGRDEAGGALALALDYPRAWLPRRLQEAQECALRESPSVAEPLAAFCTAMDALSPEQREELYTRTFDINPVCSLEIGWQLFGEEYHRGALLVRLRSELRRHGIEETAELPDHLTHVLSLLDRMDAAQASSFAHCCVIPAVDKMLLAFGEQDHGNPDREDPDHEDPHREDPHRKNRDNPYGNLLLAVARLLKHRFVDASPGDAV